MTARLQRLRAALAEHEAENALLMDPVSVSYLSGFTGSTAALLVTPDRASFVTDSRYAIQAERECPGWELTVTRSSAGYNETLAAAVKEQGLRRLVVEGDYLTVSRYEALAKALGEVVDDLELKPVEGLVNRLRRVKDEEEIGRIRAACEIADRAFDFVLTLLRPGASERDIAVELEYFMKKQGSEKEAFDTIVASGARSALPHGRASDKSLEEGDFITFDFGACLGGYFSDLTGTGVLGRATERHRFVYEAVLEAQLASLDAIRGGRDGAEVDAVAREVLKKHGLDQHFGHSLGHGLGRHVHDHPALAPKNAVTLEPGMVLTVEPGVYIDGWGGVRIEDDVVVREHGCEILTLATKQLIEVPV